MKPAARRAVATSLLVAAVSLAFFTGVSQPTAGPRDYAAVVSEWARSLAVEEAAVEQIARYSSEEDDLGEAYPAALAAKVRSLLIGDAARALATLPEFRGEPIVAAEFLEAGFADPAGQEPDEKHQRKFEEGFIRIESRRQPPHPVRVGSNNPTRLTPRTSCIV